MGDTFASKFHIQGTEALNEFHFQLHPYTVCIVVHVLEDHDVFPRRSQNYDILI